MTFNEGARGEAGRVQVQGGGGGGGRGGKIAIGGGAGGIIVLILALLFGGDPGSLLGTSTETSSSSTGLSSVDECTGAQANADVNCRVTLTVGSLDDVWEQQLVKQTGTAYVRPEVVLFSGSVNTGCGQASSDVGPFYCPADQTAYFDVGFFDVLKNEFGSSGGPLAQEYVVAHGYGHHVQNLTGDLSRAQKGAKGATGGGVRSREDVARILDAGAARVVVGSLAVRQPQTVAGWLAEFGGERITVALDTRQDAAGTWRLPVHGWTEDAGATLDDLLPTYLAAGLRHLLCTDIARDGMLSGPNLDLYAHLRALAPGVAVQASGGVRDAADVHGARQAGCAGAVLGRALLEGRLHLADVAAALVDDRDAEAAVRAATLALPRALHDEDARFAIDEAQSHELLWFAVQEFPFIF